jgi:hypothetical protein
LTNIAMKQVLGSVEDEQFFNSMALIAKWIVSNKKLVGFLNFYSQNVAKLEKIQLWNWTQHLSKKISNIYVTKNHGATSSLKQFQ